MFNSTLKHPLKSLFYITDKFVSLFFVFATVYGINLMSFWDGKIMLKANNNFKEGDTNRHNVYLLFHLCLFFFCCNKNVSIKDHCLKRKN